MTFSSPASSYGIGCAEQCPCSDDTCHHVYKCNVTTGSFKYTFFTKIRILSTSFNDAECNPILRQTIDSNGIIYIPLRIETSKSVSFYSNTSDRTMNIVGNNKE